MTKKQRDLLLEAIAAVARVVAMRHYTGIKPGKRMDELQALLDALDALDAGDLRAPGECALGYADSFRIVV